MVDLESLKESLRNLQNQLAAKRAEQQGYRDKAAEIKAVYDRMSEDKDVVQEYRRNLRSFRRERIDTFEGNLYTQSYLTKMDELLDDYDLVIENLDENMDRLNTLRAQYENKAYQCNGPIGYLQSSVNSLIHTIQNWVN